MTLQYTLIGLFWLILAFVAGCYAAHRARNLRRGGQVVGEVPIHKFGPHDIVVVETDQSLTAEQAERVRHLLHDGLTAATKVLLLDNGMRVMVLRRATDEPKS